MEAACGKGAPLSMSSRVVPTVRAMASLRGYESNTAEGSKQLEITGKEARLTKTDSACFPYTLLLKNDLDTEQ